jgi:hypothetical protein
MAIANTITYETLYEDVLQDRLDRPTTWKEMCDVTVSDTRVISSSYMSTTPSVQAVTRGTGHAMQTFVETAENLTISTGRDLGLFVDWGDLAQSPWTKPAELFDRIGALLNEYIESAVLAQHATWTDFGTASIGGGGAATDPITVSASNIDDIIRGVKREIREASGQAKMNQYGVGFVWRAADFELLEAFVQANGFMTADQALKEGTVEGLRYLGADHYWSNDHTAGHVFAGVKNIQRLGILRGTYGKAHTIEFPAGDSNTYLSGVSFYSRVDIGHLTPTAHAGLVFDINVA